MTTGFELVVAYYFVAILTGHPTQVGPFSSDSQCERIRQWLGRKQAAEVSECWYGPAVSLTRGKAP